MLYIGRSVCFWFTQKSWLIWAVFSIQKSLKWISTTPIVLYVFTKKNWFKSVYNCDFKNQYWDCQMNVCDNQKIDRLYLFEVLTVNGVVCNIGWNGYCIPNSKYWREFAPPSPPETGWYRNECSWCVDLGVPCFNMPLVIELFRWMPRLFRSGRICPSLTQFGCWLPWL